MGGGVVNGESGQTGDTTRLATPVRTRRDSSERSKQGQEKVSAEVRGAPEHFVATPRDVSPSGDYRRGALSRRLQSLSR